MTARADQSTLARTLLSQAERNPARSVFRYLDVNGRERARLSFGELDKRARAVGAALMERGLAGKRALLIYPSGLDFLCGFFGCAYARVAPIPLALPRTAGGFEKLRHVLMDASPSALLTSLDCLERFPAAAGEVSFPPVVASDAIEDSMAAFWRCPDSGGDDLALIQYTSGSTAQPKGVMLTHENLRQHSAAVATRFGHNADSVMVTWLPMFHDMGLIYTALEPVYGGFPCVMMSPQSFLRRPGAWLAAISLYGGTHSAAPNFAYDLCTRRVSAEQKAGLRLATWRVALNGAEPVRGSTLRRFSEAFEPCGFHPAALTPGYGLAEATLMVSSCRASDLPVSRRLANGKAAGPAGPISEMDDDARSVVSVGSSGLNTQVAIVDPETLIECPEETAGEIWVTGPAVANGYWNRTEETQAAFGARTPSRPEAFLRTGDLGVIAGDQLYIIGRLKDIIIIGGRNYVPQDIEETVEACHPAIRAGSVAAFAVDGSLGEELAVVAGVSDPRQRSGGAAAELAGIIREAVAEAHEIRAAHVQLAAPGAVPKTSSGKIQRRLCRTWLLNGTFAVAGASGEAAQAGVGG